MSILLKGSRLFLVSNEIGITIKIAAKSKLVERIEMFGFEVATLVKQMSGLATCLVILSQFALFSQPA